MLKDAYHNACLVYWAHGYDLMYPYMIPGGGGGTLGISGWECTTGTLEPLTYTRASSAE